MTAQDLRYAWREVRNQWGLTAAVVLTLAIGIGSPTVVFSLLSTMALRTPPSHDPNSFFRVVREPSRSSGVVTLAEYRALADENRSARRLTAWSSALLTARIGGDRGPASGLLVTCDFFSAFGVDAPVAGRLLTPEDCTSRLPVAVMSERCWRSRFGADPSVVGRSFPYGGVPVVVVGIAATPAIQVRGHFSDADSVADLCLPYTTQHALKNVESLFRGRDLLSEDSTVPWLELAGLLEPRTSRGTAANEFRVILARHARPSPWPASLVVVTDGSRWSAMPLKILRLSMIVLALPVLILITACVNVAALLIPRAAKRVPEMAVRLALGASRAALIRMLLIESTIVCGLAALLSLFLVYSLPRLLVRALNAESWVGAGSLGPDWRAFTFLAVTSVAAAILSGLAPALESLNPRLAQSLRLGRGLETPRGSRAARLFVGIQIATSTLLLVTAAAFVRTATRTAEPGFSTTDLLVAELPDDGSRRAPLGAIADGLSVSSGVEGVAYAKALPLLGESAVQVHSGTRPEWISSPAVSVSPDYFRVLGIPILMGRALNRQDAGRTGAQEPVVVSRQFARRFFGKDNVLGERIAAEDRSGPVSMTIVGVAQDRSTGQETTKAIADGSMVYEPMDPSSEFGFLLIKASDRGAATADVVRARLRDLTGSAAPVATFESRLAERYAGIRRLKSLSLASGAASMMLALIGLVAVITSEANRRRREFAIRLALGATPSAVRRRIVLSGLRLVPIGLSCGVLASWSGLRVLQSQRLLMLAPFAVDPSPYIAPVVLFLAATGVTLAAIAYRVGRRDSFAALREE